MTMKIQESLAIAIKISCFFVVDSYVDFDTLFYNAQLLHRIIEYIVRMLLLSTQRCMNRTLIFMATKLIKLIAI